MNATRRPSGQPGSVQSTTIVGTALVAWSIGSYAFYLIVGRVLGPEEYGLVAALQGVIVVLAMPATALQWSIARLIADGHGGAGSDGAAIYRRSLIRGTLLAIAGAVLATAATVAIHEAVPGTPLWPLVTTYIAVVPLVPLMLSIGALQGEQRYVGYGLSFGSTGVLRAPLFAGLIALPIGGVEAAMLATGAGFAVGAVWAAWLTRTDLVAGPPPSRAARQAFNRPLAAAGVGLAGLASLINLDVVFAKIGLGGAEAGYFGAAAVLAKALILVPHALTIILLPRVARREAQGEPTGALLAAGVSITFATGIVAMALALPLEGPLVTVTFGSDYEPAAELVLPLLGATTLLGALLILVNHHVARNDHRFVWAVGALAIVHIVLLAFLSHSAYGIIAADAITAGLGLVIHEIMYWGTDEGMVHGLRRQAQLVRRRARRP